MHLQAMPSNVLLSSDGMAVLWLDIMCVNMCSYALDKELCKGKVPKKSGINLMKTTYFFIYSYMRFHLLYAVPECSMSIRAAEAGFAWLTRCLEAEETTPCGAMNGDAYDEWEL